MPSSSGHSTCQEQDLLRRYKAAYLRLFYTRNHHEAQVITDLYSALLEIDKHTLLTLALKENPAWNDRVREHVRKQKMSSNIESASEDLSETSATLMKFGRVKEATEWSRLAEEMLSFAGEVYEEEQFAESRESRRRVVQSEQRGESWGTLKRVD